MAKRRVHEDSELILNNAFNGLYHFCISWKEIIFEYITDWRTIVEGHVSIVKVCGFTNPGFFREYLENLFEEPWDGYIKSLQKKKINLQLDHIKSMLLLVEDFKALTISTFPFEGKQFKRLNKWILTEEGKGLERENALADEKVLTYAEPYADAFLEAMSQFKSKLEYTKHYLENQSSLQRPIVKSPKTRLSFHYIEYSPVKDSIGYGKLDKLYNSLMDKKYLHSSTKDSVFIKAFSGSRVVKYIIWIKGKGEFLYFVQALKDQKKVDNTNDLLHWKFACDCFKWRDGTNFTRDSLRWGKIPKNAEESLRFLDSIIEAL